MTGTDAAFEPRVAAFLDRLRRQQPVAIIQFGSALRPGDFVPGFSDFDLVVLSHEPLVDVENDVDCEYFFLSPHEFVKGLAAGDMFWLSALQSGRVLFDPQGFLKNLKALVESGLHLRTTLATLQSTLQIVTHQLSLAMNRYFCGQRDRHIARAVFKCLYSAAKGLGAYHAIAATGEDPHGFEAIARAVRPYPAVEALMRRSRDRLGRDAVSPRAGAAAPPLLLEDDDELGGPILEIERAYCESVSLLPGRRATNDLIREYARRDHPRLERVLAVGLDLGKNRHLVAGQAGGGYCVFGSVDLRQARREFVRYELPDLQSLARFLGWAEGHPPAH